MLAFSGITVFSATNRWLVKSFQSQSLLSLRPIHLHLASTFLVIHVLQFVPQLVVHEIHSFYFFRCCSSATLTSTPFLGTIFFTHLASLNIALMFSVSGSAVISVWILYFLLQGLMNVLILLFNRMAQLWIYFLNSEVNQMIAISIKSYGSNNYNRCCYSQSSTPNYLSF